MFKKIVILLTVFILVLSVASILSACKSEPRNHEDVDNVPPQTATKLRQEFQKYLEENSPDDACELADIWVQRYLGKFNGCEVVYMGSNLTFEPEETTIEIAGYLVRFPDTQPLYAFRDDTFLEFREAYECGWVTSEDVRLVKQKVSD